MSGHVARSSPTAAHAVAVLSAPRADSWIARMFASEGSLPSSTGDRRTGLVRRASQGDQPAFEELMRAVGDRLLGTARKILRDPDAAEDAVQQTVILAWRLLPRLRDPERFDGWLYKILVSSCYAEGRRARRFAARVTDLTLEPAASDQADVRAERDVLERAFQLLTPAHRAIVVLHYYAGLPLTEVAVIVGVRPGTVRSRLHYAIRALRAALEAADRPTNTELDR